MLNFKLKKWYSFIKVGEKYNAMKGSYMKKIVIISIVVVLFVVLFGVIKSRMCRSVSWVGGGDLVIINNSTDTASTAFSREGKMMSQVMNPGDRASGGRGLIRIFTPKKNGAYEIQYPFPRPSGKPVEISLTQVFDAVHNPKTGDELITEKGMIADIRVDYEEVRDLDATY